jgi:hypothetical protein
MEDLNFYIECAEHELYVLKTSAASRVSEFYLSLFSTSGVLIPRIPPSLGKMIIDCTNFYNRRSYRKSFDFWGDVVVEMMESLDWEIHLMEVVYLRLNFFRLLVERLVELFSWVTEINSAVDDIECSVIEASRDPPSIPIFIPIPKIESSNGCARSDSLIRLLIF